MSLNVLCIGLGLGGSRFAHLFSKKTTTTKRINTPIFLNSSLSELNIFKDCSEKNKIKIGASDGAGKDRGVAIEYFTKQFDYIGLLNKIKEVIVEEDVDVVSVSFSCSGGTGSGISPLLIGMLTNSIEKEKVVQKQVSVIGIGLLPSFNEGINSFRNTLLTINDIKKGIGRGNRYFLVKNEGLEGSNFTEKCEAVNHSASTLLAKYFRGTSQISQLGVLDMNDRRTGLSHFGLHSLCKLDNCEVTKSPFVTPGTSICKSMLCEIPEENSDVYENYVSDGATVLDFKYGYTAEETGIVAYHGYMNLEKEMIQYRKRFDDLKLLDSAGNISTGDNALKSLKDDVFNYSIKENNSVKDNDVTEKVEKKNSSLNDLISDFTDIDSL